MLTELKRCNSIGNIDGVLFLVSMLRGRKRITADEIRNRCSLENGIVVNCPGAIAFFEYLKLIERDDNGIAVCESFDLLPNGRDEVISSIVSVTINQLVEDGIFDSEQTSFDAQKGHLTIKRSAFPLAYAAIRNFLTIAGVLDKEENGEICVKDAYESDWTHKLRERRKKFTLAQLIERQEEQSRRGLEAEEFVLKLEQQRLPQLATSVKRISDFDVSAGYDIVSYQTSTATRYNRFIEVKTYIGNPHFFWSENEADVARLKGDEYWLCLVDYFRMSEPGYEPEFIQNPYTVIFNNEQWLVSSASYKVQKL